MGRIHPEAESSYFSSRPEHRALVKPFLTAFDVTRASWVHVGNASAACFYLKPEPFIAELIGLEREMLLVYAPYSELQARTIKLHDHVLHEDRLRLDPVGTILVCDDPNTCEFVASHVMVDPERPPIVSLSKSQLQQLSSADDIRSLLFEQMYSRDLFGLESPLRSELTFFGRDGAVSQLLDRFRSGQNSGLFGLRRIGKTSVLYAVKRRAEKGEIAGGTYMDMSNPSAYSRRWWMLLQEIIKEIAAPLGLKRGDRSKIRALNVSYDKEDAANHFKQDVMALSRHLPGGKVMILLDEVEYLTFDLSPAEHWTSDFLPFWQAMRSVHQDTEGVFGFIVAGVNPKILEADRVYTWDNPLFSTATSIYLGPFELSDVRQMVRTVARYMGLRVEEGIYKKLYEEYGGHPFLVRQACSHLSRKINERPGHFSVDLYNASKAAIGVKLEKNVKQILNVLAIWYPEEYELLRLLARGDRDTFLEFAEESASFTEHVVGYGLVTNPRKNPEIVVGLVRSVLAKVPRPEEAAASSVHSREEVQAEISRRRNAIEEGMRRTLRLGLEFAYGKKAAAKTLEALPEKRGTVLVHYSYREIWPHLYFSELIMVVKKYWQSFQNFFSMDQEKVLRMLDHINACRVDAHARSLDEESLTYLRVCFRTLEEALES